MLIIGGDKSGDARFYRRLVPASERIWREVLAEQSEGLHDDEV